MKRALAAIIIGILAVLMCCGAAPAEVETDIDATVIARVLYAECRGVESVTEQAAVAWCILNRVDDARWGDTVREVVTDRWQFAYSPGAPVTDELYALAQDVLLRWELEKLGVGDVGRVLPGEYVYFAGRDGRNWFRTEYRGAEYWGWTGGSPYEEEL